MNQARTDASDRGDIILGWLTKLVLFMSVLGVIGYDAVALGSASFTNEDHATQAARSASETFQASKGSAQLAYNAALQSVASYGDTIDPKSFAVTKEGAVTLTLHHEVSTLVVHRIGPLKSLATMEKTVTARASVN